MIAVPPVLRLSSQGQEIPLEASKWLRVQLLVDADEMAALVNFLQPFFIFALSGVMKRSECFISPEAFLEGYKEYVAALQRGEMPDEQLLARVAPTAWTGDSEALYALPIGDDQQIVRILYPVIQLQHHRFDYSPFDGRFRSQVLGPESVTWGIQFSYPQIFKDPKTRDVVMLNDPKAFVNTGLFRQLQKWMRDNTIATPFVVNGEQVNVPIRLGKRCLPWINRHPQLAPKGLSVMV